MQQFLAMGGYGQFVWPAYALGLLVFAWNIASARRRYTNARERALRGSAGREGAP